jgi:hypothetical protein
LQELQFVRDDELQVLIKVICSAMHENHLQKKRKAFAPMPQHIVFEKLIGLKPRELLFLKTSAAIVPKHTHDGTKIRVKVQGPEMDGNMFAKYCEKEEARSLVDVFNGVDVMHCVIIEVDLQNFSVCIGNRKWMMAMHEINVQPNPELRSQVLSKVPKDPADAVIRSRLSSLPWFKNISVNEAKQVRHLRTQSVLLSFL